MSDRETDEETGTETTGHEWDGIKELDTPLPRWWLYTFYVTIVWGVLYTIAYPAWPMISSATAGVLGFSTRGELAEIIADHEAAMAPMMNRIAEAEFTEIASNAELDQFAQAGGAAIFRTYCSQCHGAGAAGAVGYPNLLDDDWLWGGSHDAIYETLLVGIRWEENFDTRLSMMPAFGDDEILSRDEIASVADYVLSLSGAAEPNADGALLYEDNCAACHGDDGEGVPDLGAPTLSDAIWLYGGDRATVIETITHSRAGVMPAWNTRLTEAEIKQVAHYVHSLGGGE
ncbi:MAG: cytochrome-c oxidase, cbb3-type subunit III [Pseudomonadota bacterium]